MQVETIKKITISATAQGVAEASAAVSNLAAAQGRLATASNTTATVTDLATKRQLSAAQAYQRQTLAVVEGARAQDQIARATKVADAALQQGIITQTDHARRVADITQKYSAATSGIGGFGTAMRGVTQILGAFGIAMSAASAVQFLVGIYRSTAALDDQAKEIGISTDALQAYRAAALDSGASADIADTAIRRFTRSLGEAGEGNAKVIEVFRALHLTARDLAGGPEAALPKVITALSGVEDVTRRATFETTLFGKSGQQVENVLGAWGTEIDKLVQHYKDLNLIVSEEQVKAYNKAEARIGLFWMNVTVGIVGATDKTLKFMKVLSDLALFGQGAVFKDIAKMMESPQDMRTSGIPFRSAANPRATDFQTDAERSAAAAAAKKAIEDEKTGLEEIHKKIAEFEVSEYAAELKRRELIENNQAMHRVDAQKQLDEIQKTSAKEVDVATKNTAKLQELSQMQLYDRTQAAEDAARTAADAEIREQQRAADQSEHYWDRMFDNMFQSGRINFRDFLKNLAIDAIARPIIVPILMQMAGSLGLGGLGTTGGAGSLLSGLGGSGGGLGSLFSGGGLGSLFGGGSGIGSVTVTPSPITGLFSNGSMFGGGLGGPGIMGSLSSFLGPAALGFGIGSFTGGLTGGANGGIASGIGGALGGIAGSFLGPLGTMAGAAIGGAIGGLIDGKKSNFTAYANFGSDYSLSGGIAGDKPNSTTTGLAQQAGAAISASAKALEAAGVTLKDGVQRLEIGERDQSRLILQGGKSMNIGGVGDVQAAVTGTIDYLLGGATSSNPAVQKVLDYYKGNGGLNAGNADKILAAVGGVSGFDTGNQAAIDQLTNPVLAAWNALMKTEQASLEQARLYGLDTTLLERRNKLEQQAFIDQLNDKQRAALEGLVDLANDLRLKIADAKAAALAGVDALLASSISQGGQYRNVSGDLAKARAGTLAATALDPISRYRAASGAFQSASGLASGGDLDALNSLPKLAQDFANASLAASVNAREYNRDLAAIADSLGSAGGVADAQAAAYDVQVGILEAVKANLSQANLDTALLQQQLAALGQVGNLVGAGNGAVVTQLQLLIQLQAQLAAAPTPAAAATVAASTAATIAKVPLTGTQLAMQLGPIDQLYKGHNTSLMDIQQALIAGATISDASWAQAGLPPGGNLHYYASGGDFGVVGEHGPELINFAGASGRIYSNSQSKSLLDMGPLVSAIRALQAEVANLRASSDETASNTRAQEAFMRRISPDGNSIRTTAA